VIFLLREWKENDFTFFSYYFVQSNETLLHLRMTGNKIGNKGGMYFASMLQVNCTLEKLDLGDCDLVSEPVESSAMT